MDASTSSLIRGQRSSSNTAVPLLTLPIEIFDMVLSNYVFRWRFDVEAASTNIHRLGFRVFKSCIRCVDQLCSANRSRDGLNTLITLGQTCKDLHEVALSKIYGDSEFMFDKLSTLRAFLRAIGAGPRNALHSLRVHWLSQAQLQKWKTRQTLTGIPGLRHLCLMHPLRKLPKGLVSALKANGLETINGIPVAMILGIEKSNATAAQPRQPPPSHQHQHQVADSANARNDEAEGKTDKEWPSKEVLAMFNIPPESWV